MSSPRSRASRASSLMSASAALMGTGRARLRGGASCLPNSRGDRKTEGPRRGAELITFEGNRSRFRTRGRGS